MFQNAKNEQYFQLIPYYDPYSEEGKIIFPWIIEAPAALYPGSVSFSVKFFKIDPNSHKLIYELNTQPAKTKVLAGYSEPHTYNMLDPQSLIINDEMLNSLSMLLDVENFYHIYWIDV